MVFNVVLCRRLITLNEYRDIERLCEKEIVKDLRTLIVALGVTMLLPAVTQSARRPSRQSPQRRRQSAWKPQ
jgi:hypothetical protein